MADSTLAGKQEPNQPLAVQLDSENKKEVSEAFYLERERFYQ